MNKLILVALASTTLAGCHSLFGSAAKLEVRPLGTPVDAAAAAIALEEGRQHLLRGAPASAIVALRAATIDPATAAQAHNGLAVAYAMLGRGDLAERYFHRAVEQDPSDPRFAANLARFYASREAMAAKAAAPSAPAVVAIAEQFTAAPAAAPVIERTMQAGPSIVRVDLPIPTEAMTRVSRQEVVIRTRAPAAALVDTRRRNPRFSAAAGKPVAAYPVRIELPVAKR